MPTPAVQQQEDQSLRDSLSVLKPPAFPDVEQALQSFHSNHAPSTTQQNQSTPWWKNLWLLSPTLAAGAFCLLMLFVWPDPSQNTTPSIAKGTSLELWYTGPRLGFRSQRKARDGEKLLPGTQIKFKLRSHRKDYGMLVLVNQQGKVTVLAPLEGRSSLPLARLQNALGPLELDDYIGKERVFALFAPKPFSSQAVQQTFTRAFQQAQKRLLAMAPQSKQWQLVWSLWYEKQPLRGKP